MPLMKGSAFTARFDYLKKHFPERWPAFLAALAPPARELALSGALNNAWYPFDAFVDLNLCAVRVFEVDELPTVLGAYAAEANVPTLYKLFFKLGSPAYVLSKAAMLWHVHHDTGRAELLLLEDGWYEYRIHEFGSPNAMLCRSLQGFIRRTLEMAGAKNVELSKEQCAADGAPYCAFRARWR
jgi:hypothetical protein